MADDIRFDSIEDAIADIRNGKLVVVVDDEDRENEGDFVTGRRGHYAGPGQLYGAVGARADVRPAHARARRRARPSR